MSTNRRRSQRKGGHLDNVNAEVELEHVKHNPKNKATAQDGTVPLIATLEVPDLVEPDEPPHYTIDLSLAPRKRYMALAGAYREKVLKLPVLFDEILEFLLQDHRILKPWFLKSIARLFLRRVHDDEQMQELIGIQEATGIDMYLLIAYNVLLDLLVGCTSGGIQITDRSMAGKRMMHFRTLDWAMDPLRHVVVQLNFVHGDGPVIARSITYVGFVGMLTGVRHGLSLSFNFRSNIKTRQSLSRWGQLGYMGGKLLVLLGQRSSIPSTLRTYILPRTHKHKHDETYELNEGPLPNLQELETTFPGLSTSQCFIIACDGTLTAVIEKDWKTATIRADHSFIVCTNHDESEEVQSRPHATSKRDKSAQSAIPDHLVLPQTPHIPESAAVTGMQEILEESVDRKRSVEVKWRQAKARYLQRHPGSESNDAAITLKTLQTWTVSSIF